MRWENRRFVFVLVVKLKGVWNTNRHPKEAVLWIDYPFGWCEECSREIYSSKTINKEFCQPLPNKKAKNLMMLHNLLMSPDCIWSNCGSHQIWSPITGVWQIQHRSYTYDRNHEVSSQKVQPHGPIGKVKPWKRGSGWMFVSPSTRSKNQKDSKEAQERKLCDVYIIFSVRPLLMFLGRNINKNSASCSLTYICSSSSTGFSVLLPRKSRTKLHVIMLSDKLNIGY
jgi:hypothetical protein